MGIVVALLVLGMTPEQEVEAWQPSIAERQISEREANDMNRRIATLAAPVLAVGAGVVSGLVIGAATTNVTNVGLLGFVAGGAAGIAAFEAVLAFGFVMFLPERLPVWAVPVALTAATVGAFGGVALGAGLSWAFLDLAGAGGPNLLVVPALTLGLAAAGAATGATLGVAAAELE